MSNTVEMPKLGFDMAEGKLAKWVKGESEKIEKGDVLAEIETDKATVEVESPFSGIVAKHLVEENSVLPVGTPIAVITDEGEEYHQEESSKKESVSKEAPVESVEPQVKVETQKEESPEEPLDSGLLQAAGKTHRPRKRD